MILITGATGFIGRNLIPEITKFCKVRILVRRTSDIESFKANKQIEIVYGDLDEDIGLVQALDGIDTVIHCAARTIGKNFFEYYKTNTTGTKNLINAMDSKYIKGIIYLSSHAAYGPSNEKRSCTEGERPQPISFYGVTKKCAEEVIRNSCIPYIILRPVSVYGPHDMDILKYIRLLYQGICPIVGFGEKYINLIYVDDLIQLIIKIIRAEKFYNRTYFVNDSHWYSYDEVLNEIDASLHKKNLRIHVPTSLALFIGLMNDVFLHEKKRRVWRDKVRELAANYWLCSNERLIKEFSFVPQYSLKDGMKVTIQWYKEQGFLE